MVLKLYPEVVFNNVTDLRGATSNNATDPRLSADSAVLNSSSGLDIPGSPSYLSVSDH